MTSQTTFSVRDVGLAKKALERWRNDPVLFAEEVLGIRLWSGQKRMLRALVNGKKVAIRSGHKCGKSTAFAVAAIWWWATHPRATVVITAPTSRQIEKIIWKELRRVYKSARFPLGGNLHLKAEAGLQSDDGREIVGFATDEPERIAGFSGANLLFLVDEASGVPKEIFAAIEGNMAGGASLALVSNPTQLSGVFFDAFHADQAEWNTIHISSLDCSKVWPSELGSAPNGLATTEWCEMMLRTKGENSIDYQVRVLGNFPTTADDTMIAPSIVTAAQERWFTTPPEEGALQFGVDVARFGSDLSAICYTRGKWLSEVVALASRDNVEVAGKVASLIREVRRGDEPVTIAADTTNNGGVADILRNFEIDGVQIVDIQYAARPTAPGYRRMRDQLWGSFKEWLTDGGAIPPDKNLAADITAPKYGFAIDGGGGLQVEGKDKLKARIGRSPDRADAATLATFPVHTLIKKSGFWTVEQGQDEED